MKHNILALLSVLVPFLSFSQEIKKDTIKTIKLQEVIVTGNLKVDPVHTSTVNNHEKNVVQPKNVADLFQNINGFSVIKRGNYAIDPSFRAAQYEQLNIQYDGGTKAMHACPNRMDPITTHVIPEKQSEKGSDDYDRDFAEVEKFKHRSQETIVPRRAATTKRRRRSACAKFSGFGS